VSVPHTGERPLDGRLPGEGLLGLLHLLIDAVQGPPGPVGLVLVRDFERTGSGADQDAVETQDLIAEPGQHMNGTI
jgi:hypothetical protein